jgi:ribosome-binding factor A
MSERTARLDELLREEISAVIQRDVDDPRVGFVTVTDVEVAPDLRHAKVWVSVIGTEQERKATLRALGSAMPFVRQRLGKLRLKRIPELHVKLDTTAERGTRLLRILDDLESGRDVVDSERQETLPTPGKVKE